MSYVLLSDIARWYVVLLAMFLIAVLLRITWTRTQRCGGIHRIYRRQQSPHPFSTLGLAVLMTVGIVRRFDTLGQPGDGFLWAVTAGVSLVGLGVAINIEFDVRPPWRRR